MKTVLIIQNELPSYRNFLWEGLRKAFNLYLADESTNQLICPDGSVTTFQDHMFKKQLDCVVVNAGIREIFKAFRYIRKYRPLAVIGWSQFVGKNKSFLVRLVKSLYLMTVFDKVMLYYEHEKYLMPLSGLKRKSVGLNNTVADWPPAVPSNIDPRAVLFLGRYTEKSKLSLLLEAALEINDIKLHIVGVQDDEVPVHFRKNNFHFHGRTNDLERISEIAARCTYFVYPGDVGLSIVHAVKLGLIPVVHADLDAHMPECRAVAQALSVVYFQKDDRSSLSNVLSLLLESKSTAKTKKWIVSKGYETFAAELMITNFINVVEGR